MSNYFDCIDETFDFDFKKSNYPWLPWVGSKYAKSEIKTIILGESIYRRKEDDPEREAVDKRISRDNHLRKFHHNNGILRGGKSQYARNFERAVFQQKNPCVRKTTELWLHVSYHNLVLTAMETIKHRPSSLDYSNGWEVFLELAETLGAVQCIVYGNEWRKVKALTKVLRDKKIDYKCDTGSEKISNNIPKTVTAKLKGNIIKIIFIRHPSSHFCWEKWGEYLKKELIYPR